MRRTVVIVKTRQASPKVFAEQVAEELEQSASYLRALHQKYSGGRPREVNEEVAREFETFAAKLRTRWGGR